MPWFELGRSFRTRGAHPCEKTALRVIPDLSPQGHPSLEGPPRRGGLRTPGRKASRQLQHCPFWPRAPPPVGQDGLARFAPGPAFRTRRPRPSEKIAFRVVSALSPLGDAHCDWPPPGGAGSARPRNVGMVPYRCIPHRATEDPSTLPGQ